MGRQNWITDKETKANNGTREITVLSNQAMADGINRTNPDKVIITSTTREETSTINKEVSKVTMKDKVTGGDTNLPNNSDGAVQDRMVASMAEAIMVLPAKVVLNMEKVITDLLKVLKTAKAIMVLPDREILSMVKVIMAVEVHSSEKADGANVTNTVSVTWKEADAEPDLNTVKEDVTKVNNTEDDTIAAEIILPQDMEAIAIRMVTRDSDPTKVIMVNAIRETVMKTESLMAAILHPVMTEIAKTVLPVQNATAMQADMAGKNSAILMEIVRPVTLNTATEEILRKTLTVKTRKNMEKVLQEAVGTDK